MKDLLCLLSLVGTLIRGTRPYEDVQTASDDRDNRLANKS